MSLRILTLKPLEKKAGVLLGQGFHFEGPTLRSTDFVIEPPKKNWFSLFLAKNMGDFNTSEDHQTKGTQTKLRNCEHKKMVSSENGRKVTHLEDHPS